MAFRSYVTRIYNSRTSVSASLAVTGSIMLSTSWRSRDIVSAENDPRLPCTASCKVRTWAENKGIYVFKGVDVGNAGPMGSGLFCGIEGIPDGATIISVPKEAVLSAMNVERDPSIAHIIGPLRSAGLDDRGTIALWLLLQSREGNSDWKEYISSLPSVYELSKSHPLLMSESLQGTSLGTTVDAMKRNISRQMQAIRSALTRIDPSTVIACIPLEELEEAWRWAHTVVMSRSGVSTTEASSHWSQFPLSMIPVVDYCNHSDEPNARIVVREDQAVELTSTRQIRPGEQICISYWSGGQPLNSEQSLFSFGFLSSTDRFILPGITFEGCEDDPRKAIQRLIFLDSSEESGGTKFPCLSHLRPALDFMTVRAMNDKEVKGLTDSYVSEGRLGPCTRRILQQHETAGRLSLLKLLTTWRTKVAAHTPKTPVLLEFRFRLLRSIDSAIEALNS